jgi:hypothetical protein
MSALGPYLSACSSTCRGGEGSSTPCTIVGMYVSNSASQSDVGNR